jgi:hypothetical protein
LQNRAEALKLIGWYVFNLAFAAIGSIFAVGGDGSAKGVLLVLLVFGGSTAVCAYLSAKRLAAGNPSGALKAAKNAIPAGILIMMALALIQGIRNVAT